MGGLSVKSPGIAHVPNVATVSPDRDRGRVGRAGSASAESNTTGHRFYGASKATQLQQVDRYAYGGAMAHCAERSVSQGYQRVGLIDNVLSVHAGSYTDASSKVRPVQQ